MSEVLKTLAHKDMKIEVVFERGSIAFRVPSAVSQYNADKKSLTDAQEAIDKYMSTQARYRAGAMDIAKLMIDPNCVTMTIKGLNRKDGDGRVTNYAPVNSWGRVSKSTSYRGKVYPDRSWIRDLLTKKALLQSELREVEQQLDPVEVHVGAHVYGGTIHIDAYERHMTELATKLEQAIAAADKHEHKENA